MPVSVMPPPRKAEYVVLEAALPGRKPVPAGVLLLDTEADQLYARLRADWTGLADPADAEVLGLLAAEIEQQAREMGAAAYLGWLEDTLSNALRLSERRAVVVCDFRRAIQRLYEREIEGARKQLGVMPETNRVPVYSLRAAAGKFGPEQETDVQPEDWITAPEGLRGGEDYFACYVQGRSMEPRIPDGSLCLFRKMPAGSRQGKLVLVRHRGSSESGGEFTVKRYRSEKTVSEEGWRHTRVVLEPLNPDYPTLELGPDEFQVIAEFVRVIPVEEM